MIKFVNGIFWKFRDKKDGHREVRMTLSLFWPPDNPQRFSNWSNSDRSLRLFSFLYNFLMLSPSIKNFSSAIWPILGVVIGIGIFIMHFSLVSITSDWSPGRRFDRLKFMGRIIQVTTWEDLFLLLAGINTVLYTVILLLYDGSPYIMTPVCAYVTLQYIFLIYSILMDAIWLNIVSTL